jgi:hypothetical protein
MLKVNVTIPLHLEQQQHQHLAQSQFQLVPIRLNIQLLMAFKQLQSTNAQYLMEVLSLLDKGPLEDL